MHEDAEPNEIEFADKRRTRLLLHRAPTPLPNDASTSFLGGLPRLPPDFDWPTVPRRAEDGDGEGLIAPTFIAQIDLATLPFWRGRELFPDDGTIYVFCNTQFVGVGDPYCKVIFHKGSSSGFPERAPPPNLMRIGGTYDRFYRAWLQQGDALAGIDNKFGLTFEWSPKKLPDYDPPDNGGVDWLQTYGLYSSHPLLMRSWPHTPLFSKTLRAGLIASVKKTRTDYDGKSWPGYDDLTALARSLPELAGEPFRWLDDMERNSFRTMFQEFVSQIKLRAKDAPRFSGAYSFGNLVDETAFCCTARGFAEGFFNTQTDSGHLHRGMEDAAATWRQWKWPHQMLGAGTNVQDAPYEHADKALMLQISGWDLLAGSVPGGVLQFWVSPADLKAGRLENVFATLECS